MTNQQHPITPPPELVEQWFTEWNTAESFHGDSHIYVAAHAAQWGADQELEACCEWFICDWTDIETADKLRVARRPKPPSLKEQALEALKHAPGPDYPNPITLLTADEHALIRRALEQLSDD